MRFATIIMSTISIFLSTEMSTKKEMSIKKSTISLKISRSSKSSDDAIFFFKGRAINGLVCFFCVNFLRGFQKGAQIYFLLPILFICHRLAKSKIWETPSFIQANLTNLLLAMLLYSVLICIV